MRDNISPEERLLRLIKGQKKRDTVTNKNFASSIQETKRATSKSLLIPIARYLSFFNIRKVIYAIFAASCIYLIVSFIYPWLGLRKIKLPQVAQEKFTDSEMMLPPEVKPYEFYSEAIKNRQIFSNVTLSQKTEAPSAEISRDLIKDINLVGIISGDNPQAVIEDKKMQKTYYLNKGQSIGEFTVEEIQEGKVILNYKGQRLELYL